MFIFPRKRESEVEKLSHREVELRNKRLLGTWKAIQSHPMFRGLSFERILDFVRTLPVFEGIPSRTREPELPEKWLEHRTFEFAGQRVPKWLCEFDMIFSGGKGTGKTTVMKVMMWTLILSELKEAMAQFTSHEAMKWNAFSYTPKNDDFYWPLKAWLRPYGVPVRSTNPFREDSWAWWPFEKDITNFASLEQAVRAFIKEDDKEQNRYFRDASRLILRAVILSLMLANPRDITFRRIVKICQSRYLLRQVLHRTSHTRCALALIDEQAQGQAAGNVYTTLLSVTKDLEIIAAEVDDTPEERRYSLADIASRPGVWVWESDPRYAAAMELDNGIQDDILTQHLLVRGNIGFTTYRFIDELPQLNGRGKSTTSQKLSEWGRTSRVRNAYAIQSPSQLQETWGHEGADGFLGQCHSACVFRHKDSGARYWSERFGNLRGFEQKHSYQWQNGWSSSPDGGSANGSYTHGVSIERFDRANVPPGAIGDLPIASILYGIHGFAELPISSRINPETRAPDSLLFKFHLSPEWMQRNTPPQHPEFKPYDQCMKPPKRFLKRLEDDDYRILRLDRDPTDPEDTESERS